MDECGGLYQRDQDPRQDPLRIPELGQIAEIKNPESLRLIRRMREVQRMHKMLFIQRNAVPAGRS